jgi:hypothetical protein
MSNNQDPNRIQALVKAARVLGLHKRDALPDQIRKILAEADQQGRMLEKTEIELLCTRSKVDPDALTVLQSKANALVNQTKQLLITKQPELLAPGGALFPASRADACWRDCYHFLRVSCYAVAVGEPKLTDPKGIQGLQALYEALAVPIPALLFALAELRHLATETYRSIAFPKDVELLDAAIRELESKIKHFRIKS